MLNEYHKKFLNHLVKHAVSFLIIGGQARHLLDPNHQTIDMDIWVRINPEDIPRLERAIIQWANEHPQHNNTLRTISPLGLRPRVLIQFPNTDGVWFLDRSQTPREVSTKDRIDILTSLRDNASYDLGFDECMRRGTEHCIEDIAVYSLCSADLDRTAKELEG